MTELKIINTMNHTPAPTESLSSPVKIEIGGGFKPRPGYLQVDVKKYPWVDIVGDVFSLPYENEVDEIFAHWVLEHFAYRDITTLLTAFHKNLKPGGLLHLVTNNGQSHINAYNSGEINIHELNRMIFGLHLEREAELENPKPGHGTVKLEDCHKIIWTEELVHHFFDPIFSKIEVEATWLNRNPDGSLKCPGLKIKAIK